MHDGTQRLLPGQIRAFDLRRHAWLLALDGALHLTYRDAALDGLPGGAPRISVLLDEGAAHRLPHAACVDVTCAGAGGVTLGITSPPAPAPLRALLAWAARTAQRRRRPGPHGAR